MDEWRKGKIEINQLSIPNLTDINIFYNSGLEFLKTLKRKESQIIIATRSNLVLLANIMLGNNPSKGGGYKEIPWENAGFVTFEKNNKNYVLSSFRNILK